MMVRGNDHAIAQAAFAKRSLQIRDALIAIRGVIGGSSNGRGGLASVRAVLAHTLIWNLRTAVRFVRHHSSGSVHN
jgi:hypothetical protein